MWHRNFAWLGLFLALLSLGSKSALADAYLGAVRTNGVLVIDSSQAITGTNGIFSGTLSVTGAGTFNGAVTHNAALTVAGGNKFTFSNSASGGLFLNGTATAIMDPSGNLNVPGTLTQTGASTFNGAATFAAAGTALSVTNNATVGGTLGISGLSTLSGGFTSPASCTVTSDKVFTGLRPESYGSSVNFPAATTANRGRLIWNVGDKHYYMSDGSNFIQVTLANDPNAVDRSGTVATAANATSGSVTFSTAMATTPVVNLTIGTTGAVNSSAYNLVQASSISTTGFTWNMDTNPGNAVLQWHAVPVQ